MQKKELTTSLRYFFGFGDFCFNTMTNIETYYFMFFLTNVAQFNVVTAGIISTVTSTVDACLSWIYGAIINSVKPMKWGRYRSWYIVTPWIVPFINFFSYYKIGSDAVAAVIITVAFILAHVIWNFGYVTNVAIIPTVAHTQKDRVALSSMRATWNNLASVLVAYTVKGFVSALTPKFPTMAYAIVAFVWAALTAVGLFVHFKLTEGYEATGAEELAKPKEQQTEKTAIGDLLKALFQNIPLLSLLIADLARWLFKFVVGGTAAYYFTYVAKDMGPMTTYLLLSNILGICGAYLSRFIANKFSPRNATILVYAVMAIALFVCKFIYLTAGVWTIIILLSIAQLGYGAVYSLVSALYADAVVYAHWKTGKNPAGWVMGLQNLPLKVGVMGRSLVISIALGSSGFKAGMPATDVTPKILNGISNAIFTVPGICLAIGVVLLLVGYRITKKNIVEYQAEIDAREAAK